MVAVVGPDGPCHDVVPTSLPRQLDPSAGTVAALSRADIALGRLAGNGRLLPNPHPLSTPYVQREAVSRSRIEGTQTSLSEVLTAQELLDVLEGHPLRQEDSRGGMTHVVNRERGRPARSSAAFT